MGILVPVFMSIYRVVGVETTSPDHKEPPPLRINDRLCKLGDASCHISLNRLKDSPRKDDVTMKMVRRDSFSPQQVVSEW